LTGPPGELLQFAGDLAARRQSDDLLQRAEFLEGGERQDEFDGRSASLTENSNST
jgi:hypothetical protein